MSKCSENLPKVDFDTFSHNYSETLKAATGLFKKGDDFFALVKLHCLKRSALVNPDSLAILDFGCGVGTLCGLLASEFPNCAIEGYDISEECLSVAKTTHRERNIQFISRLVPDKKYELVIVANVFHHLKAQEQEQTLSFLKGLLKPNGQIAIFEHNPLNPLTRHIVKLCPFDAGVKLIRQHELIRIIKSCGLSVKIKCYILFFPWAAKFFRMLEYWLRGVPLGAQYLVLAG